MGVLTLLVSAAHAAATLVSFRLGLYLFIFFYVTYPRLFAIGIGGQGFALTAQRIMLIVMAFIFFLKILYGSADARRAIRILWEDRLVTFLFIGLLVSRILGNILTGRIDLTVVTGFADEFLSTLFIVLMICCCLTTKEDIYKLWVVVAASVFANELVACIEFVTQASIYPASLNLDFETTRNVEGLIEGGTRYGSYRVMGLFDSPLKLMAMGCLSLPILWCMAKNVCSAAQKLYCYTALICLPIMIILTGSRTGIIVMILASFCYLFPYILNNFSRIEKILTVTVISGLIIASLAIWFDVLITNFLFGTAGRSSASRVFQYVYSWPLLLKSPIVGYGYARNIVDFIDVNAIDSYYLRAVMEGGVVALGSLLALFRITFIRLRSVKMLAVSMADKELATALQVSLAVIAIIMLVINMGTVSLYAFAIFGSAIVLSRAILRDELES